MFNDSSGDGENMSLNINFAKIDKRWVGKTRFHITIKLMNNLRAIGFG